LDSEVMQDSSLDTLMIGIWDGMMQKEIGEIETVKAYWSDLWEKTEAAKTELGFKSDHIEDSQDWYIAGYWSKLRLISREGTYLRGKNREFWQAGWDDAEGDWKEKL